MWNYFAHYELFGISPLRSPLIKESLTLGSIQIITLLSLLVLIFIIVVGALYFGIYKLAKSKNREPFNWILLIVIIHLIHYFMDQSHAPIPASMK